MTSGVNGIHHITAISGHPRTNHDFYTRVLGLRFVKKTVNFDDPTVYHLYYADETGTPGTVLTFFPWDHMAPGRSGNGETALIQYAVPAGSLDFWEERLALEAVTTGTRATVFGEERLPFADPDGLRSALVVPAGPDDRAPWTTAEVDGAVAIRGFHGVSLQVADGGPTADLLTTLFGYREAARDGAVVRYVRAGGRAPVVDLIVRDGQPQARLGRGSVHHVAFSVADDPAQEVLRARIIKAGHRPTPVIDRNYFHSIYFREPGGTLFEIATDGPGFLIDEPVAELGRNLRLPPQHEHLRDQLEMALPPLPA